MTMKLRILLILTVALGQMFWTSCGHYSCTDTFSPNNCSTGGGGGGGIGTGGGGGGGTAASAYAFAVDQTLGSIDGYTLSAGASTFQATTDYVAPAIPLTDPGVGVVVAQKQFLYAVFGSANQIYGWSISSAGTLTALPNFPMTVPLIGAVPTTFHQVSVITNPAGTLLFIAQTLSSTILVYQISTTGALTAVTGSPFLTGADEPINLGMDGLGNYLYVTEDPNFTTHTATKTAAYAVNATTGALTAVPGSPFAFNMWEVQGDPSGQYLVGITGESASLFGTDDDHIYDFGITTTGANAGAITQVTGSPFTTTYAPFNLTANPVGEFIYTFSVAPGAIGNNATEGYQLNLASGALTAITGSPFTNLFEGGNGQFEQTGTYLFAYSGDVILGSLVELNPFVASNTGVLTSPFTDVELNTTGYWAVTAPK
jgi:hypothetical protein